MSQQSTHSTLDKGLFEQLFKTHFEHLVNFADQYVHDLDTAKDITQKVYINLWESREKIDPKKALKSYLFTSVRNRCLNHIRDHKKYRSKVLDLETVDQEFVLEEDDSGITELQDKVAKALQALPEKCRLVFEMSRYQNMKYKDIAADLGVSQKTVEAHMSKALRTLREELKDYVHLWWLIIGFFP